MTLFRYRKERQLLKWAAVLSTLLLSGACLADPLSTEEITAMRAVIAKNWKVSEYRGTVTLRVRFNPDGTLSAAPQIVSKSDDPRYQAAVDSAVKAVVAGQPYKMLMPRSYNSWKYMDIDLDPRTMESQIAQQPNAARDGAKGADTERDVIAEALNKEASKRGADVAAKRSIAEAEGARRDAEDPYAVLREIVDIASRNITPTDCTIRAVADFERYPSHLGLFRETWLNKDFSVDFYSQRQRQVFLFVVLKRYAELMTEGLYRGNPTLNGCSFNIDIKSFDKFGQSRNYPAVSWRFNRSQADKVAWDTIDPRNFQDIAIDYKISAAMDDWISGEPSMGGVKSGKSEAKTSGCDERFLRANAIFIRATTFCKKNYMDSRAGYYALAMFRQCTGIRESELRRKIAGAMEELDRVVKQKGNAFACGWVDEIERSVIESVVN